MKVVKRIEDINEDIWCYATKQNYEFLKSIGVNFYYEYEEYASKADYLNTDISDCVFQFNYEYEAYRDNNYCPSYLDAKYKSGAQFVCAQDKHFYLVNKLKFYYPKSFNVEILKIIGIGNDTEYIGTINDNVPAKWNAEGICLTPGTEYNLYKEYKQRIYTRLNTKGFYPFQKFIVSSTEKMSTALEKQGWRLATNEEIEEFKI